MGKIVLFICHSESPTDSKTVFCVIYNTVNWQVLCRVFSKYKDSAQKTAVCLFIISLLPEKAIVSWNIYSFFFSNLKLTWSRIFEICSWVNFEKKALSQWSRWPPLMVRFFLQFFSQTATVPWLCFQRVFPCCIFILLPSTMLWVSLVKNWGIKFLGCLWQQAYCHTVNAPVLLDCCWDYWIWTWI